MTHMMSCFLHRLLIRACHWGMDIAPPASGDQCEPFPRHPDRHCFDLSSVRHQGIGDMSSRRFRSTPSGAEGQPVVPQLTLPRQRALSENDRKINVLRTLRDALVWHGEGLCQTNVRRQACSCLGRQCEACW